MLIHLMTIHGVCIYDVNLPRRDKAERCLAFFMLKRKYYKNTEKGRPPLPAGSVIPGERIHPGNDCVKVDFYAILSTIVERFNIHVTCIEYLELGMYDHVAWLIVACPGKYCDSEVILSNQCASPYAAKQSVAERAIQFLMLIYNFLVEDANFHFLQQSTLSLKLERQAYLAIKDRIFCVIHSGQPQSFLDEEWPATPRGPSFRIPEGPPPPIPPKKRLSHASPGGPSNANHLDFFDHAKHPRKE